MAYIYFPGCKPTADYKEAAAQLQSYVKNKFGIDPIGCCRVNHPRLTKDDTAIVVCNNCAEIIGESAESAEILTVWEIIDKDVNFPFPDYHGEKITVQDCWISREKRNVQDAVRSLLHKMNFEVVELEDNYEKTKFCGANMYSVATASNLKLAPQMWQSGDIVVLEPEQKEAALKAHANKITTERTVCYCKFCKDGIDAGGKTGVHLLELLFGRG